MTKHQHHSKRKQVRNACLQCRNAHAACCEKRPCERCIALGCADECVDVPRRQRVNKSKLKLEGDVLRFDAFLLERKRSARIAGQKREHEDGSTCEHDESEHCGCAYTSQRRNSCDSDVSSSSTQDSRDTDLGSHDGFVSEEEEGSEPQHHHHHHEHHSDDTCTQREAKRVKHEHSAPASLANVPRGVSIAQYLSMQLESKAKAASAALQRPPQLSTSCAPMSSPSSASTSPASEALSNDFNGQEYQFFCLEDYGSACYCGEIPQQSSGPYEDQPIQWSLDETIFGQYR